MIDPVASLGRQDRRELETLPEESDDLAMDLGAAAEAPAPFDRDRFLMRQKLLSVSEAYRVFDEEGRPILFAKREAHLGRRILMYVAVVVIVLAASFTGAMLESQFGPPGIISALVVGAVLALLTAMILSPKRHITFFADETMQKELMHVFQDQKIALISGTFTIADSDYALLGWAKKNYLSNVIRRSWELRDAESRLIARVREDSLFNSLMRRFAPGGALWRTNFHFFSPADRSIIGSFNRKFTVLDRYVLDMAEDRAHTIDRRLAVAMAVLLDTGEKR
jgi:uncharacterized protein YxjI